MKFTKIRLVGLHTTDLPILGASPSDPYILKASDGLGPPEIDVILSDTSNEEAIYHGSQPQNREIVIRIGLNPDYGINQTVSEMRAEFYGLLTPGFSGSVQIQLMDGEVVVAYTIGYAKLLEVAPFSETPELQVTLACLSPYLEAANDLYVSPEGSTLVPEIVNVGNAKVGFKMGVTFIADVDGWSLVSNNGQEISINYQFLAGDKLVVDTRAGSRGLWLTRQVVTESLIHALASGSSWIQLYGGRNRFDASSGHYTWDDVLYRPRYWGV